MGHVSTFSFYGNKLITTGEGGMVTTNDAELARRMKLLRSQGMDPTRRYWYPIIGYNYRMTNVAAAIGLGQLEKAAWHAERRLEVARWYQEEFAKETRLSWQVTPSTSTHIFWMFTVLVDEKFATSRDDLMRQLRELNIETRPVFYPMHQLPPYAAEGAKASFPVADSIARRGINLPTWSGVTRDDVKYVADSMRRLLDAIS
jgi:perosamine synthetase